ncbi:hypothetical protein PRIPAC_70995, partial [Pristionchus pacificus]|uniref:Uncharacterized protein n=1 Tax=Pristionchus pacificus TaxID=54126 RepID=A0A2A6CG08_PRIPA
MDNRSICIISFLISPYKTLAQRSPPHIQVVDMALVTGELTPAQALTFRAPYDARHGYLLKVPYPHPRHLLVIRRIHCTFYDCPHHPQPGGASVAFSCASHYGAVRFSHASGVLAPPPPPPPGNTQLIFVVTDAPAHRLETLRDADVNDEALWTPRRWIHRHS